MMLITQAKEAENLRNKEMKKYAEDREHCLKQQNEMVGNSYTLSAVYFACFLWLLKFLPGILRFLSVSTWLCGFGFFVCFQGSLSICKMSFLSQFILKFLFLGK